MLILFFLLLGFCNSLKIISSKAAGLKGFYMLGVSKYIKEHYDLSDALFYGASAGSWNSLYLSNKANDDIMFDFIKKLQSSNFNNMYEIELAIYNYVLSNQINEDFDLDKLNICVSVFNKRKFTKTIYNNFIDLEDTMNCCMASSHIPYITNPSLYYTYRNMPSIDGGFFENPHPNQLYPNLIIDSNIWNNTYIKNHGFFSDIKKTPIQKFIEYGYEDSYKNKNYLDLVFK